MNNKITVLLTALLVVTLAVPVFADGHMEDDVKITGNVKTVFQVGGYGDNEGAAADLWADDDALDESYTADPDLFPAEKAFYQEIGFNVAAMVNDNVSFDLAIDTLTNEFTETDAVNVGGERLGDPGETDDLIMDSALLTISDDVSTIKLGDMGGYHGSVYFLDDEDVEGMELTTKMSDNDIKAFAAGDNDEFVGKDFYGVTVSRALNKGNITGKLFHERDGETVTDLAVAVDTALTDVVSMNGELVASDDSDADSGTLMMLGADFKVSDTVTMNAGMETADEDFTSVSGDLEEANNYDLFTVGGDMVLDANNTFSAAYTMVDGGSRGTEDTKNTIDLSLANTTGDYKNNASISFTTNDGYIDGNEITVIKLGTEYAMDMGTASASLTNQSADSNNEFTYLTVGYNQQISDNVTWDTSLGYIDGENAANVEGNSSDFETSLTVSF